MAQRKIPAAPAGLGKEGRALWRSVLADLASRKLGLGPWELHVLTMACRETDTVARLEAEVLAGPTQVKGSQGQPVSNPSLVEARHGRALVASLLARLRLATDPAGEMTPRSRGARRAAEARWGVHQRVAPGA